jgi:hypothetical protein
MPHLVKRLGASLLRLAAALSVAVFTAPSPVLAHHSFAMFDANQTVDAIGTVKELQWGNPHTWLEVIVQNPDKTEKPLSLELNGLGGLRRNGWKPGSLKPGDKVTVTYHPMRDGTSAGQLLQVVTEDGQILKGQ